MIKILSDSAQKTRRLGEKLAKLMIKENKKGKHLRIVALEGELGGGKTTFLQGFAKGLGVKENVLSPTFVIMKKFEVKKGKIKFFYHLDCYRIEDPYQILKLGFKKIISDSKNVVAVEWAENISSLFPPETIFISFKFVKEKERMISMKTSSLSENILSHLK